MNRTGHTSMPGVLSVWCTFFINSWRLIMQTPQKEFPTWYQGYLNGSHTRYIRTNNCRILQHGNSEISLESIILHGQTTIHPYFLLIWQSLCCIVENITYHRQKLAVQTGGKSSIILYTCTIYYYLTEHNIPVIQRKKKIMAFKIVTAYIESELSVF